MYTANDCIKLTQQYLRNYRYYVTAVGNLTDELDGIKAMLADEPQAKTTDYSAIPGCGGQAPEELNPIEKTAALNIELQEEATQKEKQLQKFKLQVDKLRRAMEQLPEQEKMAVSIAHVEGLGVKQLSDVLCFSERQNRRILRNAEKHVAIMLFGGKAAEDVFFFS